MIRLGCSNSFSFQLIAITSIPDDMIGVAPEQKAMKGNPGMFSEQWTVPLVRQVN